MKKFLIASFMLVSSFLFAGENVSSTAAVGKKVTIEVAADGSLPLSYQWTKDSVDVTGAVSSSLVIASVATSDAGVYACKISNAAGSIVSPTATLTVLAPPTVKGTTIKITVE